jgi:hypothetical protein
MLGIGFSALSAVAFLVANALVCCCSAVCSQGSRPASSPGRRLWIDLGRLIPAGIGILLMPEPVTQRGGAKLRLQALAVPAEIRAIFIRASLAGFAGFAVLGLTTAVAPAFLGEVLGVKSRAVVGLVVFAVFVASALGQFLMEVVPQSSALPAGCVGLIAGMGVLALGLVAPSLALLVAGAMIAGTGRGSASAPG